MIKKYLTVRSLAGTTIPLLFWLIFIFAMHNIAEMVIFTVAIFAMCAFIITINCDDNDTPVIDKYGSQCWNQYGVLHRGNDLPAVIRANGTKEWYQYGRRHRDNDKPAIIFFDGTKVYYKYGREYYPFSQEVDWMKEGF